MIFSLPPFSKILDVKNDYFLKIVFTPSPHIFQWSFYSVLRWIHQVARHNKKKIKKELDSQFLENWFHAHLLRKKKKMADPIKARKRSCPLLQSHVHFWGFGHCLRDSTSSRNAHNLITGPPNVSMWQRANNPIKILKVKTCWKEPGLVIYLLQMPGGQQHCLVSAPVATVLAKQRSNSVASTVLPAPAIGCIWFHSPLLSLPLFLSKKFYPGRCCKSESQILSNHRPLSCFSVMFSWHYSTREISSRLIYFILFY